MQIGLLEFRIDSEVAKVSKEDKEERLKTATLNAYLRGKLKAVKRAASAKPT